MPSPSISFKWGKCPVRISAWRVRDHLDSRWLLAHWSPIWISLHRPVRGIPSYLIITGAKKLNISQWQRNVRSEGGSVLLGGLSWKPCLAFFSVLYNSQIIPKAALIETWAPALSIYGSCASFVFGLVAGVFGWNRPLTTRMGVRCNGRCFTSRCTVATVCFQHGSHALLTGGRLLVTLSETSPLSPEHTFVTVVRTNGCDCRENGQTQYLTCPFYALS